MMNSADQLLLEVSRLWAPPPRESLSVWAEREFRLSPEYSAVTGRLRLYKFQREPLDSFTDPHIREIVIMSATQMLKTLTLQAIIGYVIARDPGPILLAQPTEKDAESFSKERISPMIRDIPALRVKVSPEKRTSKGNTILQKDFLGGALSIVGAQTPGNFARRSIRVFLADERDKWKTNVGKEGDGFSLGVKRTATFRSRAKIVQVCSPTLEGDSAIAAAYEGSDRRKFYIPCHACGQEQVLEWGNVRWEAADPAGTAHYECASCGLHWNDAQRWAAAELGEWRADRPSAGVAGFWISELYSPWKKLGAIATDFLAKKDNPSEFQTFVNTSLAEVWRQAGEEPANWETLRGRKGGYKRGQAPVGTLLITAGADVQKDRIVVDFWGWGRTRHSWFLDRQVLMGDTSRSEVWEALDQARQAKFRSPSGIDMSVSMGAIDSGYATTEVYAWARGKHDWIVIKGQDSGAAMLGAPRAVDFKLSGKRIRRGARVWPLNVSMAKSELYSQLRMDAPICTLCLGEGCESGCPDLIYPAGWVFFADDTEDEWFRELCAERFVTRTVKGFRRGEWIKERERNEALDTRNYSRAAAEHAGVSRYRENNWHQLARFVDAPVAVAAVVEHEIESAPVQVAPQGQDFQALARQRARRGVRYRL